MSKINKVLYNVDQRSDNDDGELWMARHNIGLDDDTSHGGVIGRATTTDPVTGRKTCGIAPLDSNGLVPSLNLPAQVNADWNSSSGASEILNKPDLSVYATTQAMNTALAGKQDTIADLDTIRGNASTAVQPGDLATVATTGSYSDLLNSPSLATVATTGAYSDLSGTPDLSLKENAANKAQTLDPTSTTEFPSSAAAATFINSSIATSTATFLGNFTLSDLGLTYPATDSQISTALGSHAWPSGTIPTRNDYVYVEIQNPQTTGIDDCVKRFKFDSSAWLYEYTLNNSSFTASEKDAIDSGINSTKVTAYDGHLADGTIHVTSTDKNTWDGKQDAISDLLAIRSGASAGATAVQPGDLATVATTGSYSDLLNKPTIPSASSTTPSMDGTASAGSESAWSRGDHVHPTDTSRAPKSHASSGTTYGTGTTSNYGHVKLATGDMNGATHSDGVAVSKNHTHGQYVPTTRKVNGQALSADVTIATPGTLVTDATTAQAASSGEGMSGTITLHKVSKTGSFGDLLNVPTTVSGYGITDVVISGKVITVGSDSVDLGDYEKLLTPERYFHWGQLDQTQPDQEMLLGIGKLKSGETSLIGPHKEPLFNGFGAYAGNLSDGWLWYNSCYVIARELTSGQVAGYLPDSTLTSQLRFYGTSTRSQESDTARQVSASDGNSNLSVELNYNYLTLVSSVAQNAITLDTVDSSANNYPTLSINHSSTTAVLTPYSLTVGEIYAGTFTSTDGANNMSTVLDYNHLHMASSTTRGSIELNTVDTGASNYPTLTLTHSITSSVLTPYRLTIGEVNIDDGSGTSRLMRSNSTRGGVEFTTGTNTIPVTASAFYGSGGISVSDNPDWNNLTGTCTHIITNSAPYTGNKHSPESGSMVALVGNVLDGNNNHFIVQIALGYNMYYRYKPATSNWEEWRIVTTTPYVSTT